MRRHRTDSTAPRRSVCLENRRGGLKLTLTDEPIPPGETRPLGLSVLMPCYNEAKSIQQSLLVAAESLRILCDRSFEILLIDDGSVDETWTVARSSALGIPEVRLFRDTENGGKGAALRRAFHQSRGELVCFLDCGLDISPKHVMDFVRALEADSFDVAIGSKRHPESKVDYPWRRRFLSKGYELLVRVLFGLKIRDTQAGIKVFKREVLEDVLPLGFVKRYAFDAEMLVLLHRLGHRIMEMPIEMKFREEFGTGVDARAIVQMFLDTLGVFYRLKVKDYYGVSGVPSPARS